MPRPRDNTAEAVSGATFVAVEVSSIESRPRGWVEKSRRSHLVGFSGLRFGALSMNPLTLMELMEEIYGSSRYARGG